MLSELKRLKIFFCCYFAGKLLKNILEIMEEGGSWKRLSQWTAIKKWSNDKFRHTTKKKQPRSYKSRNSAEVIVKSLSDGDAYDEKENISENRVEEEYLFSSDSE